MNRIIRQIQSNSHTARRNGGKRAHRGLAPALALILWAAGAMNARADGTCNINTGDVTGDGLTFSSGVLTVTDGGTYTVTGNGSGTPNRIQVNSNLADGVNITLQDVKINVSSVSYACAFDIRSNTTVSLTLSGTNSLQGSGSTVALSVGGTLKITGDGSLDVRGGQTYNSDDGCYEGVTAIGGSGTLEISGGTVTAAGGGTNSTNDHGGAGIGCSTVKISGGTVTADGGFLAAGIGGAYGEPGKTVTVSGGTVTANGIGGGSDSHGSVIVSGTTVVTGGSIHSDSWYSIPVNGNGDRVYPNILTVGSNANAGKAITAGSIDGTPCTPDGVGGYGINDVKANGDGRVCFWLPVTDPADGEVRLTTSDGNAYGKTYVRNAVDNYPYDTYATLDPIPAAAPVNFPAAAAITYGQPLSASVLTGGTADRGIFTWLDGATVPPVANTGYTLVFTPLDLSTCDYGAISGWDATTQTVRRTVTVTVNQKSITCTGITATKTYDGSGYFDDSHIYILSATLNGIVGTDDVTPVKTGATGNFATKDVQSGDVTFSGFTLTGTDAGNYTLVQPAVAASITKKNITVNGGSIEPKTYDGTTGVTVTGVTFDGLENSESLAIDTDCEVSGAVLTDPGAGNRTVRMTVTLKSTSAKAGNYNLTNGTDYNLDDQTVAKADPTAAHLSYDLTGAAYDGQPHGIPAPTVAAPYSGMGAVTVYYNSNTALPDATGTYAVTVDIDGSGANFNAITDLALGTFTIAKAAPAAAHLDADLTGAVYDGLPHAVTVAPKAAYAAGMGAVTVKYDGSTTPPADAGTYTVTVDIDGSGANFDAATGLAPGTFTITKATPAAAHLDVDLTGAVYDGRLHAIPAPAVASPYSGMGAVTVKYNGSATPPTDAGTYTVTVDIDGSGANFAAATGLAPGTFTIAKATPAAEHLDVDLTDAVYDGLPHAIPAPTVASPYSGMGVITVKYDGSAAVPTETGTYAVTADIDGSGANFDAVTGLALGAFTIAVPSGTDPVAASIRVWSYAGRLYIASPATSGRAYVYHVSGQLVKILPYVAGETLVQALPAGVYVVTVRGRDCKVRIH